MFPAKQLRYYVQKVLPLVYDDSLSYYELLAKVVYKLNEVIENENQLPDYIRKIIEEQEVGKILSGLLDELREQIAAANEGESKTATAPRATGDLVWLNGELFKVTHDMIAGDQYFAGSNCEKTTVEKLIKAVYTPATQTLTINGIIDGEVEYLTGDVHTYNLATQTISIERGDERG